MTTGACVARLSADRMLVLCGHQYPTGHHCATERNEPTLLARVESAPGRVLVFAPDWEPARRPATGADDGRLRPRPINTFRSEMGRLPEYDEYAQIMFC